MMPFLKKSRRVAAGQSILKDARMRFREAAGTGGAYLVLEVVEASAGNIPAAHDVWLDQLSSSNRKLPLCR